MRRSPDPPLFLLGNVSSKAVGDRAGALAGTISPQVVNLITVLEGRQLIQLGVKFAEIDRSALQQLGLTIISTGAANTLGAISTQQFGGVSSNVGAIPANARVAAAFKARQSSAAVSDATTSRRRVNSGLATS
jgi:Flp pilus assembly secretin CpaC